ncbi:MAG: type II toxin-antitoxin system RelE/ParE family toxin, partial [Bacteroidota bacterium]
TVGRAEMNHKLSYAPKALKDIDRTLTFLSEIHHDLPRKFRNTLADKLSELDEQPERWAPLNNDIRAIRFKLSQRLAWYAFYHFSKEDGTIFILRIIPQRADPTQWPQ